MVREAQKIKTLLMFEAIAIFADQLFRVYTSIVPRYGVQVAIKFSEISVSVPSCSIFDLSVFSHGPSANDRKRCFPKSFSTSVENKVMNIRIDVLLILFQQKGLKDFILGSHR